MTTFDQEILKEFLVESHENLDRLDRDFVALESDPTATSRLAEIFRTIHTIKGTSGCLGLKNLEYLTHAGESLLSKLRDGALTLTPEITSALLAMVDAVRGMLGEVEASSTDGVERHDVLVEALEALCHRPGPPVLRADPPPPAVAAERFDTAVRTVLPGAPLAAIQVQVARNPSIAVPGLSMIPRANSEAPASVSGVSDTSIRVDVGLLDRLMNLVGELVLARNQILQFGVQGKNAAFLSTSHRLNLITTELQAGVMKTRMQPIRNIWSKLPRVVRDLSVVCGKSVGVEMVGEDTELDRTIIEAIKDPLSHIVRNAVDHGIETPDVRVARGKPAAGRLCLRAFHEGGQVNIEISDDGGGIDPERTRKKAIDRGLVSPERAAHLTEREILSYIFLPGFSTAEQVTNVSGRGVGMDVVKTNIEKIGGTVDVQSRPGHGTTLKIKIPLTLAIIPALIVKSFGERFAIPQVSLLELVRLEGDQTRGVESIHGVPVYRLRGKLLPLVYLNRVLGLTHEVPMDATTNIVVVHADDRQFGLVVDAVGDTEEIVVKPLGKELKWLCAFAGATIMGDGKVALILDVMGVAQLAKLLSEPRERSLTEEAREARAAGEDRQALLLFRGSPSGRMAIPLSLVARLEELPHDCIEHTGSGPVVQYRGEILPLVDMRSQVAGDEDGGAHAPLQVVVSSHEGRSVGLVVDKILDIVEETLTLKRAAGHSGSLGAAVVQGKVTEILDARSVIKKAGPSGFDHADFG
jgi:two-component system chemotaxis sensor kinase CheA